MKEKEKIKGKVLEELEKKGSRATIGQTCSIPFSKKELEKHTKEIEWFVRKYIENDKNFNLFIRHISPYDLTRILKACLKMGMEFTWEEEKKELVKKNLKG